MIEFTNLTENELKTLQQKLADELKRRTQLTTAVTEIREVLNKYDISIEEVRSVINSKPIRKDSVKRQRVGKRSVVAKKFKSLSGNDTWSGRGKPPRWVQRICESREITLAEFKALPEYKIKAISEYSF